MYESLRSSKSLVIFSNEMGRDLFNKNIVAALCQSGKLLSVLDRPDEYNLMFVDVVERNSIGPGCGRDALDTFASEYVKMQKDKRGKNCRDSASIRYPSRSCNIQQVVMASLRRSENDRKN